MRSTADCSVITSIDLDHTAAGSAPTARASGREKAGRSCGTGQAGHCVSDPMPPASRSSKHRPRAIGADLWLNGRDFNHQGDRQQWSWSGRGRRYQRPEHSRRLRGANQLRQCFGRHRGARGALRERLPINAQAVRVGLAQVDLQGPLPDRCPASQTLVLDVAHNPQAVSALALNLDADGLLPTHAPPSSAPCADKDLAGADGQASRTLIDHWHLLRRCPWLARRHRRRPRGPAGKACRAPGRRAIPTPTRPRRWPPPWPRQTPLIESWSSARSIPMGGVLKQGIAAG